MKGRGIDYYAVILFFVLMFCASVYTMIAAIRDGVMRRRIYKYPGRSILYEGRDAVKYGFFRAVSMMVGCGAIAFAVYELWTGAFLRSH
jgi:hypothetical protein